MPPLNRAGPTFAYLAAGLIGVVFTAILLTWPEIAGTGGIWLAPQGDLAENLAGHLAFQASPWQWPLLKASNIFVPTGLSIAMTDSNPLVSLLGKLFVTITGRPPQNDFGYWCALCYTLQPIAAVYAIRGLAIRRPETALAAALFAISFPAFLFRYGHVNLLGHFWLLLALGIALRDARRVVAPRALIRFALLVGAELSHPYLFVFAALLLSTGFWSTVFQGGNWRRELSIYLLQVFGALAVYFVLSGTFGQSSTGFGFYSMNLLSPFWPSGSIFFPHLAVMDATGGQYEGYNYLGAGGIVLVLLSLGAWRHLLVPQWRGLLFVLACLTLLALSTTVYAGHVRLVSLGRQPWQQIFGWVQSSGRAFWAPGYAIIFSTLAWQERLKRGPAFIILALLCTLQIADVSPLRTKVIHYFAQPTAQALPAVVFPPETKLLTLAPACINGSEDVDLDLSAIRAGIALSFIRAARQPGWFNCNVGTSDATELPIMPGDLRGFLLDQSLPALRSSLFSAGARCHRYGNLLLCSLAYPTGMRPPTLPLPFLTTPVTLQGASLPLGYGWVSDAQGTAWSEGPRATLLFQLTPAVASKGIKITLNVSAIAFAPGGGRGVTISSFGHVLLKTTLPDARERQITVIVPASAHPDGIIRLAFDVYHPVNPKKRHISAPVQRAALHLYSISVAAAD